VVDTSDIYNKSQVLQISYFVSMNEFIIIIIILYNSY